MTPKHCVMCGLAVPGSQRVCSMCYGDIDYGRDGYYRRYVEEWERQQQQRETERIREGQEVEE